MKMRMRKHSMAKLMELNLIICVSSYHSADWFISPVHQERYWTKIIGSQCHPSWCWLRECQLRALEDKPHAETFPALKEKNKNRKEEKKNQQIDRKSDNQPLFGGCFRLKGRQKMAYTHSECLSSHLEIIKLGYDSFGY